MSDTNSECSEEDYQHGRSSPMIAVEECRRDVHRGFIYQSWNEFSKQKKNKEFCDVIIHCHEKKFHAHKNILAAVSPYFRNLFLCEFEIEKRKDDSLWNVSMDDFLVKSVKLLINIIYNRKFSLPEDDIECLLDFVKLANFCQIPHLTRFGVRYLIEDINNDTCFQIFNLARACLIESLESAAFLYIINNFEKEKLFISDGIKLLLLEHFMYLIGSDAFVVDSEMSAFSAIKSWVEGSTDDRSVHLLDLIKMVRLLLIEDVSQRDAVLQDPIVHGNPDVFTFISSIWSNCNGIDPRVVDLMSCHRHPPECLYLYAAYDDAGKRMQGHVQFILNTTDQKWLHRGFGHDLDRTEHLHFLWNSKLFSVTCISGHMKKYNQLHQRWDYCELDIPLQEFIEYQENFEVKRLIVESSSLNVIYKTTNLKEGNTGTFYVCRYDLDAMELLVDPVKLPSFPDCITSNQTVIVDGSCYFIHSNGKLDVCKLEDGAKESDFITINAQFHSPRSDFVAIAKGDVIYVIGGTNKSTKISSCEFFSLNSKSWTEMPCMNHPRCSPDVCLVNGDLYVLGGESQSSSSDRVLQTVEHYSMNEGIWEVISGTKFPGHFFRTVAVPRLMVLKK